MMSFLEGSAPALPKKFLLARTPWRKPVFEGTQRLCRSSKNSGRAKIKALSIFEPTR